MKKTIPNMIPRGVTPPWRLLLAAILLLPMVACIIGETTHSLYLEPDGAVTWVALERDVRSDHRDPAERRGEEASYQAAARRAQQPVAEALRGLGGDSLQVDVVRDHRPFVIATTARFASIEALLTRFISQLGIAASVRWSEADDLRRLEVRLDLNAEVEEVESDNESLLALVDRADRYRIVLTAGAFVDAVGFVLEDDCTAAVPSSFDEAALRSLDTDGDGLVTLSLSWR